MASTTDIIKAYDAEAITVSNTAIGFTAAKVTHASNGSIHPREATFTVETDQIRFRLDGTDPDASTGHLVNAGETIKIIGEADILAFRAIRVTTDATIFAHYFKD
jgi:hypothetical protein